MHIQIDASHAARRELTSDERKRLRQMARDGFTMREAATALELPYYVVKNWERKSAIEFARQRAASGVVSIELTRKQRRIVILVARGLSNQQIGRQLGLGESHVRDQLTAIFDKTGCDNRVRLTLWALHKGLIALNEAWEEQPCLS